MKNDQSLKELLLLPDGPPEGVWQAAMNFAFTSEDETPDYLVPGTNPDNIALAPEADVDTDEAQDAADDETDDVSLSAYDDQGDDIGPSSLTSLHSSEVSDLDETGEDYGG